MIDPATNKVVGAGIPIGSPSIGGTYSIAITPDGSRAYIANYGDNDVSVINTLTNSLAGPDIPVGGHPSGLAFTPDGARVYVTNQASRSVSVIDTATDTPAGPDISTPGGLPYGIAIASVPAGPAPSTKEVKVEAVKGKVKTKCRGEEKFTQLKAAGQIRIGCLVDTRGGTVRLTSAKGSAKFSKGLFRVTQNGGKRPYTEIALAGSLNCGKPKGHAGRSAIRRFAATRGTATVSQGGKRGRQLWGQGKGSFKTMGKFGSASVEGTSWVVEDRCDDSTLFKVRSGVVKVRDFVKKKNVTLRKGQRYVARARGR